MALDRPTLQEIINRISADIKNAITGATTLVTRSVLQVLARVFAAAVHLLYGYADNLILQFFASTATGTFLDIIGLELGKPRTTAQKATGIGEATGTVGTVIPEGTQWQSPDGFIYVTDSEETIEAGGTVDVEITAQATGTDSNDLAGVVLTTVTSISNIDSDLTIDSDGIAGGTDLETDDDYRERILLRKRRPPQGGSQSDFEQWTLEVAGVTRVWVVPEYNGVGTVGVFFVRDDDTSIFPNAAQIEEVRDHIIEHDDLSGNTIGIPVTAEPGLFVLAPTARTIDFEIDIHPNNATIQAAITSELQDFINDEGGPTETLYVSRISEAISRATGEERHRLDQPAADVAINSDELAQLGTITFGNY